MTRFLAFATAFANLDISFLGWMSESRHQTLRTCAHAHGRVGDTLPSIILPLTRSLSTWLVSLPPESRNFDTQNPVSGLSRARCCLCSAYWHSIHLWPMLTCCILTMWPTGRWIMVPLYRCQPPDSSSSGSTRWFYSSCFSSTYVRVTHCPDSCKDSSYCLPTRPCHAGS